MSEVSHYGWGPAGTTLHKGTREECPGPDCGPRRPRDARGRFVGKSGADKQPDTPAVAGYIPGASDG